MAFPEEKVKQDSIQIMISTDGGKSWFRWNRSNAMERPLIAVDLAQLTGGRSAAPPITDRKLGAIVPLLHAGGDDAGWIQLASIANRYPRVHVVAVFNPGGNGVGNGRDSNFFNTVRLLKANAATVLGYVNTDGGKRPMADVRTEVDRYRAWYPDVDGIMFDMPNNHGKELYYRELDEYVKVHRGLKFTCGLPTEPLTSEELARMESYFHDTNINTIIIYRGSSLEYPAVGTLKVPWMSQYQRSRFGVMPVGVEMEEQKARNFAGLVAGVEKLAGYVYIQPELAPTPFDTLSPIFEVTIAELDAVAAGQGVRGSATHPAPMKGTARETTTETPEGMVGDDRFGIKKIYPTAYEGAEWYMNMGSPVASDPRFRNIREGDFVRQVDGSWIAYSGSDSKKGKKKQDGVRLEAFSPDNRHWLNVEITSYTKLVKVGKKAKYVLAQAARGGRHSDDAPCEGSGYQSLLFPDGRMGVIKEINNGAKTSNRGVAAATTRTLLNRWIGWKTVIYNQPQAQGERDSKTMVVIENWIDDDVTDSNGNLVIRNDWQKVNTLTDAGGWSVGAKDKDFKTTCPRMDIDRNSGSRRRDEILSMPGGSPIANLVSWSTAADDTSTAFKYLSVREITAQPK